MKNNLRNPVAIGAYKILQAFGIEIQSHRIYDTHPKSWKSTYYTLRIIAPKWKHERASEADDEYIHQEILDRLSNLPGTYRWTVYTNGRYYIYFTK